jgi:hypothetical protein
MNARDADAVVRDFIERYTPEVAAATRACRAKLQALFPRGCELVYDNYNALAIGYAPGDKASAVVVSIAAYPRWVTLFFLHGVGLPDPDGLLQGSGSRVRSIRLRTPADLDLAPVRQLIALARQPHEKAFAQAPSLRTIVKSVSARQRPRRPAD